MSSALTRKEQLMLYKQQKQRQQQQQQQRGTDKPDNKTSKRASAPTGSITSKIQKAAKTTISKSDTKNSTAMTADVMRAGQAKVGAGTPIGKLQSRLRFKDKARSPHTSSKSSLEKENSFNKTLHDAAKQNENKKSEINKTIAMKMDEAEYLGKKHGCHVARAYLEGLPKDDECVHLHLLGKAVYWLTWIKIEQEAHQWERAEKLFMQAGSLVRTSAEKSVISAAYNTFREEADSALEAKINSLDAESNSKPTVPEQNENLSSFKRKRDCLEDEGESQTQIEHNKKDTFKNVDVRSAIMHFELDAKKSRMTDNNKPLLTNSINVKEMSRNFNIARSTCNPCKSLPGAVALPGIAWESATSTNSNTVASPNASDDLSTLLGLNTDTADNSETDISDPEPSTTNVDSLRQNDKKSCRFRAPMRLRNEDGDISSDSEDEAIDNLREVVAPCSDVSVTQPQPNSNTTQKQANAKSSKVSFESNSYSTPFKSKKGNKEKRKVTPFRPDISDVILTST